MKVLALDPSTTCTGWAFGELGKPPQHTGCFKPEKSSLDLGARLFDIASQFSCISNIPDKIVCEQLNSFRGAAAARALGGIAGVILMIAHQRNFPTPVFFNTSSVRSAVGLDIRGLKSLPKKDRQAALKERIMDLVKSKGCTPINHDEADACMVHMAAWTLLRG